MGVEVDSRGLNLMRFSSQISEAESVGITTQSEHVQHGSSITWGLVCPAARVFVQSSSLIDITSNAIGWHYATRALALIAGSIYNTAWPTKFVFIIWVLYFDTRSGRAVYRLLSLIIPVVLSPEYDYRLLISSERWLVEITIRRM